VNDNDVIIILGALLNSGYTALGISDVLVKQAYQPTLQGVPTNRAIFLSKILAPRYGYPGVTDTYNPGDDDFDTVESIWRSPTFQIAGLATQDPTDITSLTASDIVEKAADILQARSSRQTLLASGIGIQRIQDIREIYFIDDRDRHEQIPSFDFTISYRVTFQLKTPVVNTFEANINRV